MRRNRRKQASEDVGLGAFCTTQIEMVSREREILQVLACGTFVSLYLAAGASCNSRQVGAAASGAL